MMSTSVCTGAGRIGTIKAVLPDGTFSIEYRDSGVEGIVQGRPFLGGATSGFHTALRRGDQVLVVQEVYRHPIGLLCRTDTPDTLTSLGPGESALYHPDGRVLCYTQNSGATTMYSDSYGTAITIDATHHVSIIGTPAITLGGHLIPGSGIPILGSGAQVGTSPTITGITCNDSKGIVQVTPGSGTTAGALITITFGTAYASTPIVVIGSEGSVSSALSPSITSKSTAGFTITVGNAPTSGVMYTFDYMVVQ